MRSENRERIALLVALSPGIHLRALQRLLRTSFSSTRHHVDAMTKNRQILRVEQEGFSRLYPPGMSTADMLLSSALHNATDQKIVASLLSHGALSNKQLSRLTRLAKSTISEHLDKLVESGVVITHQIKSSAAYSLKDPAKVNLLLNSQRWNILGKASDRFIELWDF